jgi:AbrB family looped-hinge helix DNA binding protein
MQIAKLGRRGQMTLPSLVRKQLSLEEGDRVSLEVKDDAIVVRSLGTSLLHLRGAVKVAGTQDFEKIRQRSRKTRARRGSGGSK